MIKYHGLSLVNKDYSEAWLNQISEQGYSLQKIRLGIFYIFKKRAANEAKEQYRLEVFPKDGLFSSMPAGDVKDFDKLSKNYGLERIDSAGQVAVFKVLDQQKVQSLYGVKEEKDAVKKSLKMMKMVWLFLAIIFLFNFAIRIIDNVTENDWQLNEISLLASYLFIFATIAMQLLNIKKFTNLNKAILDNATDRLVYLNSSLSNYIEQITGILAIVLAFFSLFSTLFKVSTSKRVTLILFAMFIPLVISLGWNIYFVKKIKPDPNRTEQSKKKIFILGFFGSLILIMVIVFSVILKYMN